MLQTIEPEWEKLTPYRQVRLRTEYIFGSRDPQTQFVPEYNGSGLHIVETTWVPAIFTIFREILDNSLDETVVHAHGNRIDIKFDPLNLIFSVTDHGRGIPIEWSNEHQKHAATILLSDMFAGRNFKDDRGAARGLNGIGAKGVNFCSEWFQVEVFRDGTHFEQRFQEGDELIVEPPIVFPGQSRKSGTTIRFKVSHKVFSHLLLPEPFVRSRVQEIALCYPKLHITFNGTRITPPLLRGDCKSIEFEIAQAGVTGKFWLLPNFLNDSTEYAFSLVNGIPLFNGGTHLDAFRRSFYPGMLGALEKQAKKLDLLPNRADVSSGLLVYSILTVSNPSFDSQAKTRLINENVGKLIRATLDDPEFYKDIARKHPEWVDSIFARCQQRTEGKDDNKARRQAKRNLRQKIEDLKDACGHDRSKCILFLAEGNSAVSGLVEVRNPELHGALPLRGKVLNVFGESAKRIVESETLAKIMNSTGLVIGERANRHSLRYGKVFIATDADQDGSNIAALLVNFFYQCWPELFDPTKEPYIYVFETPLVIASKNKQTKYWYSNDYQSFEPDAFKGWEITRAKGLAALKREDWKYVLAHPRTVAIQDEGRLKEALSLLFDHSRADDRKTFIGI